MDHTWAAVSILSGGFLRLPRTCAADIAKIDTIEQECELGTIELERGAIGGAWSSAKPAALEALVPQHEAPAVPAQNFGAIATLREENEKMARERIEAVVLHATEESIDAEAHVCGLCR